MNAHATIAADTATALKPTLDQALRFAKLSFECGAEAHRQLPDSDDKRQIEALCARLRLEAMEREGLPLSLLGDGKTASQRHYESMADLHGPGWNRAALGEKVNSPFDGLLPDMKAKHPLMGRAA